MNLENAACSNILHQNGHSSVNLGSCAQQVFDSGTVSEDLEAHIPKCRQTIQIHQMNGPSTFGSHHFEIAR